MKVTTQYGVKGLNGKVDGIVYYTIPHCDVVVGRRVPAKFTESEQHNDYRLIAGNLEKIKPSQAFKDDFKIYTALYKEYPDADNKVASWYNLYIRMMWDMQKAGLADLKTITRDQIIAEDQPCKSVCAAVEAGLLLPVLHYQTLNHSI